MVREPYRSPQRQLQHYRLKRNQILTVLGKASFMNGSAFAILFVTSTGESEVFGSKAFQGRLGNWIGSNVKDEARICLDTEWRERDEQAKQGRTLANPADIFSSKGEVFHVEPDGEDGLEPLADNGEELLDGIYSENILRQQQQQVQPQLIQQQQQLSHSTLLPQQSQSLSGTQHSRPSEILSTPVLQHTPFPSTSTYVVPEAPSSGESSSRITRSISSNNLAGAATSSSSNPNPVPLRSVTFTPSSLNSWYTDKLSGLQSKASKVVCKLWIKAAQPDKSISFPYGTGTLVGATVAPPWWPSNLRHKDPDHLSKSERVTLGNALLRTSGIPLSTFERATSKQPIQPDKAALLADLYNVAAEERKTLFANDNQPFEFLQVVLPIPTSAYTQITSPQIPTIAEPVRAAPYTLSRSQSTADILSQSAGPSSRPLARSQSHSGYPTTGRDTTRRSRRPPRSSLGGSTRETGADRSEAGSPFRKSTTPRGLSTSPQPNYNNPLSFSDAGDALMAPIALQSSQILRDPTLSASRRGSHDGTPYQSRASPSSYRMQASPSEGVRSRSQNLESSFASPGMIRARSVIGNMKTIPEALPPQPSFQQASSFLGASTLASSSRGAAIPTIHPAHNYETNPYAADYPTPTYSQPQPQIQLQPQVPQQVLQERVYSPRLLHSQLSTSSSIHPSMPQPQQQQLQIPQQQQQLQQQSQEYPRPRSSSESASHQHLLQQSLIQQQLSLSQQPLHQSQQHHSLQSQQQQRGHEDYRSQQQQQLHQQAQRDPDLNQFATLQSPSLLHQGVHQSLPPDHQQQLLLQSQLQQSQHHHQQQQQQQRDQHQHQQQQQHQYQMQLQQQQQQQHQQAVRQQQHLPQQPPPPQHLSLDQQFLDQAFSTYPNFSNLDESLLIQSQQQHHPQHSQNTPQQDQQLDYLQQQLVGSSNDPFDPLNLQQHSGLDLGLSLSNIGMLPGGSHSKSPVGGLMSGVGGDNGMEYEDAYATTAEKRRGEERRRYEGLVYGTGE